MAVPPRGSLGTCTKHLGTVAATDSLPGCPIKLHWVQVNLDTGQVLPLRCDRNCCKWCGPRRAVRVATAIELAEPEWGFTLTGLRDAWEDNHPLLSKAIRSLRATYPVQVAWHLEANPSSSGSHLHGWGRGPKPEEGVLSEMATRAGLGAVVSVDPARGNWGYGMKEVTSLIGEHDVHVIRTHLSRYLERNGKRFVHSSRGFWLDRDGCPTDLRGALGESARRHRGTFIGDPSLWITCRRVDVSKVLEGRA